MANLTEKDIIDNFCNNAHIADFEEYLIDIQTRYFVHNESDPDHKETYAFLFQSLRTLLKDIKTLDPSH